MSKYQQFLKWTSVHWPENFCICSQSCSQFVDLSPLATLKNLKRLRIYCSDRSCDDFFQKLAQHRGAELEVLEISRCPFDQNVEQAIDSLKKLKVLTFYWCSNITSVFLTNLAKSSLEVLYIYPLNSMVEKGVLKLIRKSETIKVIAVDTNHDVDKRRLVLSAYRIIMKKERKYPLSLFTRGPCIIDGILHEEPKLNGTRREFQKIMKKLDYLGKSPEWLDFNIFY